MKTSPENGNLNGNGNGAQELDARVLLLTQQFTQFKSEFAQFRADIKAWMDSRQQRPWTIIGILVSILVPFWFVLNLQINASTSPVRDSASRAEATSSANTPVIARLTELMGTVVSQNADSARDRADLNRRMEYQTNRLSDTERVQAALNTSIARDFAEVETQIDATAQMLNIQWATQQRKDSDFQNALHDLGAKMPTAPAGPWFFPNVSRRGSGTSHQPVTP